MDTWAEGAAYECYMGRWSRPMARRFLEWLEAPPGCDWLDVGCGTGALSESVLELAEPRLVAALDPSAGFVQTARERLGRRGRVVVGDARALPYTANSFDVTVSGLALNFVPEPLRAVRQEARVTRDGGLVAAYVWDYAAGMQMIRAFWDAAVALDPTSSPLDEAARFPLCDPARLTELFDRGGLHSVETTALEIPMVFESFDDYWVPFLGGQGPAPSYAMSLAAEERRALQERLRRTVSGPDGRVVLTGRAWAVRAHC